MYREIYGESAKIAKEKKRKEKVKIDISKIKKFFAVINSKEILLSVLFIIGSIYLVYLDVNAISSMALSRIIASENMIMPLEFRVYIRQYVESGENYMIIETPNDIPDFIFEKYANSLKFNGEYLNFKCISNLCTASSSCHTVVSVPVFSNLDYNTLVYYNNILVLEKESDGTENEIIYEGVNIQC